jgi:hypothetical protein
MGTHEKRPIRRIKPKPVGRRRPGGDSDDITAARKPGAMRTERTTWRSTRSRITQIDMEDLDELEDELDVER